MRQRSEFPNRQRPDWRADPQIANLFFRPAIVIMDHLLNCQRAHASLTAAHSGAAIALQLVWAGHAQRNGGIDIRLCQGFAAADDCVVLFWNAPVVRRFEYTV